MRKLVIILVFLPFIGITQSSDISWGSFITVGDNTDGRPRIVLTSNNSPLIIWREGHSSKVLRASKWNGVNFSPPYDILSSGMSPDSWDGPEIAAYGDTVYVVFTSAATLQTSIMLIKSFDGGLTFSDTIRVSENNLNYKFRMGNVVVTEDGNPVVSYMQYALNWMDPKQMVNTSANFGSSFFGSVEGSQLAPGEPCDCCKSSLISLENKLFLLFRNNYNNERNSYITKSIDGGLSFISAVDMDDYDWLLNSCPATTPRGVVWGDSLVIVKRSGATGNNEIVCSSINITDLNYLYNNNIDPIQGIVQDYPEISASEDTIVVVWQDNRSGNQNCYMSFSTNGPAYLNASIPFTDSSYTGHKYDPDVEYAGGNIHLVYLDYTQKKIIYIQGSFDVINYVNQLDFIRENVTIIDVLGRKTKEKPNQLLFYIYDDGTVDKSIKIGRDLF